MPFNMPPKTDAMRTVFKQCILAIDSVIATALNNNRYIMLYDAVSKGLCRTLYIYKEIKKNEGHCLKTPICHHPANVTYLKTHLMNTVL